MALSNYLSGAHTQRTVNHVKLVQFRCKLNNFKHAYSRKNPEPFGKRENQAFQALGKCVSQVRAALRRSTEERACREERVSAAVSTPAVYLSFGDILDLWAASPGYWTGASRNFLHLNHLPARLFCRN